MRYAERDLVRVVHVRPVAGGHFELDDGREQRAYDFTASAIYVGTAPLGAATSQASWTIKRIGLDAGGNPTDTKWTDENSATWDDRTTEVYT